jgi:hypothetical protein
MLRCNEILQCYETMSVPACGANCGLRGPRAGLLGFAWADGEGMARLSLPSSDNRGQAAASIREPRGPRRRQSVLGACCHKRFSACVHRRLVSSCQGTTSLSGGVRRLRDLAPTNPAIRQVTYAQKGVRVTGLELVVIAIAAATVVGMVAAFVCYLLFCAFVVVRTGDTVGLRDVAIAVRAFASVSSSMRAVVSFPWKKS